MIRRHRLVRFPPASAAAGNDTDALQTDVMRFMSIIGLCLMAIFALVQGLPAQDKVKSVQVSQADSSRQEEIATQQRALDDLREQLLSSQAQLRDSRKEVEALKQPPRQKINISAVTRTLPPQPAVRPVTDKPEFVLRFASDAALDRQVEAGSVTLFGMIDQQAWRFSMRAGRPAVTLVPYPGWFHEMSAATVPSRYLQSLENAVESTSVSPVVWGVQLPPSTRAAIVSLIQGRQGGVLLIQGDGQVILEE